MEKPQEMRQLERPSKVDSSEKAAETSTKHASGSEDESGFEEIATPAFRSLQELDLRIGHKLTKPMPIKVTAKTSSLNTETSVEDDCHGHQTEHSKLLKELKAAHRENRDQSLELRDVKKQNAIAHEKYSNLREQNSQLREMLQARGEKISRGEKAKYLEHFEMLESHISHLQYERKKREGHMEFLTEQTREANEEKSSLESECRRLQRQVRELSSNLTEARDDLLRLQPMMSQQVPDNEIADEYASLDQAIVGWIDDQTEDSELLEEQFDKIQGLDDLPDLFSGSLSNDQLRAAKKYPESQPMVLRYLIHRSLGRSIFDKELFLFGLDDRTIALLKGIEEDSTTLKRYRSETLSSILHIPSFNAEQSRQACLVSDTLYSALSHLTHSSSEKNSNSYDSLHRSITQPAIALSNKVHLSPGSYKFTAPVDSAQICIYHTKSMHLLDLQSCKPIRAESTLKIREDDGRIGEEMLVIAPALVRTQASRDVNEGSEDAEGRGKSSKLVSKATVLVKLDEPMGKRSRGIKALGAWTPSWFGGVEGTAGG
ncbi:hypothetical protein ACLMJK_007658 [Lecanora helva]